ncbi:hypothetical protein HJC23_003905 [Cyclotella cryptica]|uniref:Sulfotransferase n=1 Tax=Cyclotella cryptica TaxID=29204 RepID=A0ABD3PDU6_9STRA|eukprot:CCRYP_015579-RA/>CCRYP_015579-RA protein AED:0.00 eAED:0.00 QI:218/1/1/1/0/0/2/247/528
MRKDNQTMAKIDVFFGFILLWSIVSTSLLVMQHYRHDGRMNTDAMMSPKNVKKRQSSVAQDGMGERNVRHGKRTHKQQHMTKTKNKTRQQRTLDKKKDHKLGLLSPKSSVSKTRAQLLPEEQYYNIHAASNEFPFTRSLKTFDTSNTFYLYIVQSTSSDESSSLEWNEVPWKQLVHNWNPSTTFDDLIYFGSAIQPPPTTTNNNNDIPSSSASTSLTKKLVLHCLPKTASTTLRDACKRLIAKKCPEVPQRHDPYGYRDPTEFYRAVLQCPEVHQFCVQGGDLEMNVIGYRGMELEEDDDVVVHEQKDEEKRKEFEKERSLEVQEAQNMDPVHFIHLVPFRNFNEWAASALKQIYVVDEKCDRINEMLEQCLGYRELYMELYTKSVLSGLIGMSLDVNTSSEDNNPWRKNEHHIVLYNYEDTDTIVTEMSNFFNMEPMPHTSTYLKGDRSEGTCPDATLERFHECHDDTLENMDAITDFEKELKRRRRDDHKMKKILGAARQREGRVRPKVRKQEDDGDDKDGSEERK